MPGDPLRPPWEIKGIHFCGAQDESKCTTTFISLSPSHGIHSGSYGCALQWTTGGVPWGAVFDWDSPAAPRKLRARATRETDPKQQIYHSVGDGGVRVIVI